MHPEEKEVVEKVIETLSIPGEWKHDGCDHLVHKSGKMNISYFPRRAPENDGCCFINIGPYPYSIQIESEENPDYYEKMSSMFEKLENAAKEERNKIQRQKMLDVLNGIIDVLE
jgi:hypothetical protein